MPDTNQNIETEQLQDFLIAVRRDLHKYPESGWCEFRTTAVIAGYLRDFGYRIHFLSDLIEPDSMLGNTADLKAEKERAVSEGADPELVNRLKCTGLIATIESGKPGENYGFRFDIDAVSVGESSSADHLPAKYGFRSVHENVSHACGHDGHTALGIALARYIAGSIASLSGRFTLVFQPAEEGCRGAYSLRDLKLIRETDQFYAFHLGICAGNYEIVLAPDNFLVSTKFKVEIFGRSAHAGIEPEKGINALHCAALIAVRIFELGKSGPSSRTNIGNFISGNAQNVISDYVSFNGECRDATEEQNNGLMKRIYDITEEICSQFHAGYKITVTGQACGIHNSPEQSVHVEKAAASSGLKIIESAHFNACEDCGHLIKAIQDEGKSAGYYILGNSIRGRHHSPEFDLDENSLRADLNFLTALVHAIADRPQN